MELINQFGHERFFRKNLNNELIYLLFDRLYHNQGQINENVRDFHNLWIIQLDCIEELARIIMLMMKENLLNDLIIDDMDHNQYSSMVKSFHKDC
jgi:hypothetical protein